MAWFVECPFCHKSVFRWFYSWHESGHTERRADGQMSEHVTLAPEKRFEGPLEGVPQAYRHSKCGVATGMPEEIIRTYLVAPLTYNDSSFCCGCGNYVIGSDLTWVETGENVMSYMGRLRVEYLTATFGIDPLATEIFLTPGTTEALREIAATTQGGKPFFLALALVRTQLDVTYKVDIVDKWDRRSEDLIQLDGIDVVVKKKQRERLKGTMIHFQNTAGGPGIAVARLYLWGG